MQDDHVRPISSLVTGNGDCNQVGHSKTGRWAIFTHGCYWHGHRYCNWTDEGGKSDRASTVIAGFRSPEIEAGRTAHQLEGYGFSVLSV